MNIGNYAKHAALWDWGGYDRTSEHEGWRKWAAQYGSSVLIPMCALGETGAYMAQRGFDVTAFDYTPEMIAEGRKRFGHIEGLCLYEGDATDFHFDIPPVDFCFCMEFGHIHSLEGIGKALACIADHMRTGGCLVVEAGLPEKESKYYPAKTFHPLQQVYPDKRVWKTGDTRIDAEKGQWHCSQTVFVEDESGNVETFDHTFYLQSYAREAWLMALEECGFFVQNEYRDREKNPWRDGDVLWIAEAIKK